MGAILHAWHMPVSSTRILHHHDSQFYLILQFISRNARILARMIEQGDIILTQSVSSPSLSEVYLSGLQYALLRIVGSLEAGQLPEWARTSKIMRPGDTLTAMPVIKAGIIMDYRSLCSDLEDNFTCQCCGDKTNRDFYACSICSWHSCASCQLAISDLSLRERLAEFGRLRQLGTEVVAVLQSLRPISHQDAGTISSVLSQGAFLQHWVLQKNTAYQKWRASRTVYQHFRQEDLLGWKAVHIMISILSLSRIPRKEVTDIDGADIKQDEDTEGGWSELSEKWRDLFAFNLIEDDTETICVHHYRQFVKIPRNDRNAALDSSGRLSAEFFEFLANKYEAALNIGTGLIDFLESTRYPDNSSAGLDIEKQSSIRSLSRLEYLTPSGENSKSFPETQIDMTRKRENMIVHSEDSSSQSSESTSVQEDLEDDDGTATDLEDFLESLLAKRSCLVKEGRLTNEDDLVFNTAWNMAQAIVYQDMPRPSLNEIAEKGGGYYTAPSTPVPSSSDGHDGTTPSNYGTPRSMSPVSWTLDLDEQPSALDVEEPGSLSL